MPRLMLLMFTIPPETTFTSSQDLDARTPPLFDQRAMSADMPRAPLILRQMMLLEIRRQRVECRAARYAPPT